MALAVASADVVVIIFLERLDVLLDVVDMVLLFIVIPLRLLQSATIAVRPPEAIFHCRRHGRPQNEVVSLHRY